MNIKIFSASFLLFSVQALAQPDSYTCTRKLDPVAKEGYYSIPLLPEIMAHSLSGGNDLRIYSIGANDTVEVPYLLNRLGSKTTETAVPFERINDVSNLKCCSYLTLKMNKRSVINRIRLDVQERNFDKRLRLEGSNDGREWMTISNNLRITGFHDAGTDFRSTAIYFPDAEFSYFRIMFDDDSSEKITVTDAYACLTNTTGGTYDTLPVKSQTFAQDRINKTSGLIVDLPGNYVLSHILLTSPGSDDFHRNITIYSSSGTYRSQGHDEELWVAVSTGVISSELPGEQKGTESREAENTFDLHNVQSRRLKIEIANYDDQPIRVKAVKLFSEKVAMFAKLPAGRELLLAYGKKNVAAPVYDMEHFRSKLPDVNSVPVIGYGSEEIQVQKAAAPAATPLLEDKKWLWLVMGLVIVIIGYFALSMLKKEREG